MRSLRARLIAIPGAILLIGLAVTFAVTLHSARLRVATETGAALSVGRSLAALTLRAVEAGPEAGMLDRLTASLPKLRHVRLIVRADGAAEAPAVVASARVPRWFARLFAPPPASATVPVLAGGRAIGEIEIIGNPLDEIAEIWTEMRFLAGLMAALALSIVALLAWSSGVALRPLRRLAEGLDRLGQGRFEAISPPIRLVELRRIGDTFDRLAAALARVTADNHHLIDRLISVQEEERKEIARELHDEFGPALFGIRAELACILRAAGGPDGETRAADTRTEEIKARAREITALVDHIQRGNARMLERLRPLILDHMGLAEALRQLVMGWEERVPRLQFSLALPPVLPALDERVGLTLFRAVQECLTNTVRHSGAEHVAVRLALRQAGLPGGAIEATVEDDGSGFAPDQRFGFGLLGMSERARGLGGEVRIGAGSPEIGRAGKGARVEISIPLQAATVAAS